MTEFREIVVLGLGRSGSNLLASILRNLRGNAGFFEIFYRDESQGLRHFPLVLEHLALALGVTAAQDAPDLVAVRNADPVGYFGRLSASVGALGYRSMSCKIFAGQITPETLEALLGRPNLSVIFLTRSRIHRYISGRKGAITGQYVGNDTTDLRPELSLEHFLNTSYNQDAALDQMLQAVVASGVPFSRICYETDLDIDAALRLQKVGEALQAVGIAPDFARTATSSWIVKQDTNQDWRNKIANGAELAAALAGLGLLDYAESAPLDLASMREPRQPVDTGAKKPHNHAG